MIEIIRLHKQSKYNCVGCIPEIQCSNDDDVINMPEVQTLINKSYGKNLIVNICPFFDTYLLTYEVSKPKAILF
jgi:hypothetical protein